MLPTVGARRYVQPLREGGSLPAVVDTDDGLYVVKFRGAGQGRRALVAELLVGSIARELGLPVPDIALVDVPEPFGRSEPDPEIRDLLRASHGLNIGLRYLDGAFNFASAAAGDLVDPALASRIVWLDAYTTNPDRTHRNPNLLVWRRTPWLIDHGAALYAHHDWESVDSARIRTPFPLISDHVLLAAAEDLESVGEEMASMLTGELRAHIVGSLPDELLGADPAVERERYAHYLRERLDGRAEFVGEALSARMRILSVPPLRLPARR